MWRLRCEVRRQTKLAPFLLFISDETQPLESAKCNLSSRTKLEENEQQIREEMN